ncbi:MAG: acyltransferase [Bacteroidales bacterium]|nr:acyltransferase [Bacteroidales bacterium]
MKERIREIDLMRGLAIIIMITGHSILVHPINFADIPWCNSLHNWIYSFHMELFFLVSGCVYHCLNFQQYIGKKIDRILVPYFAVGLVTMLMHVLGGDAVNKHFSLAYGLEKMVLYGGSYWFLYVLFLLYLVNPLIDRVLGGNRGRWSFVLLIILIRQFVKLPGLFCLNSIMYYLPYFMIGNLAMPLIRKRAILRRSGVNVLALVSGLALYLLLALTVGRTVEIFRYLIAFSMILVFYSVSLFLLSWEEKGSKLLKWINSLIELSSQYSLQLYIFNGFVLVIMRVLLVNLLHITNPIIVIPAIVVGNLVITLTLCKYVLSKTKWLAWLCGVGKRPF